MKWEGVFLSSEPGLHVWKGWAFRNEKEIVSAGGAVLRIYCRACEEERRPSSSTGRGGPRSVIRLPNTPALGRLISALKLIDRSGSSNAPPFRMKRGACVRNAGVESFDWASFSGPVDANTLQHH